MPYRLTPTELARHMMTSGGMTALLDRVERKGFVARSPNPADRRGNLVGLTDDGLRVIDEAMAVHADVEHRLVAGLAGRTGSDSPTCCAPAPERRPPLSLAAVYGLWPTAKRSSPPMTE